MNRGAGGQPKCGTALPGETERGWPHEARPFQRASDLADEVERRCKRFAAFFPLGRANLAWIFTPVLGSLDLAQQFGCVAAHAFWRDFNELDRAVRIGHESATVRKADAFAQDAEVVRDGVVLVTQHVVVDLANCWRAVVPCLVAEVRVGGYRIDFDAHTLKFAIDVGEVFEFGRADEGKVGWVEEEYAPLADDVRIADINELALMVGSCLEREKLGSDDRHKLKSF